jgi:transmembrane sensor
METDMDNPSESDRSVAEQAYEWFSILREGGSQEQVAFTAWLKTSPRHVGEFLKIAALYREYSDIDPERLIDVQALIAEDSSNVVPFNENQATDPLQNGRRPFPLTRWSMLGVAAAVMVIALAAGWLLTAPFSGWHRYENAIGEIRSFELEDGSVIHLNTRSKVKVQMSKDAREVELLAGEALFKVARDPARPFRVHSGSATIQAVGTQFNVYRRVECTTVSVIEGAVRVSEDAVQGEKQELTAGQGTRIAANGKIGSLAKVDTAKVTAWRQRRLIFRDDTLANIAAEFNRYNAKPRFRVEGEDTAAMRFTGVFDAEAPESFVRVLSGVGKLSAERVGEEVIIREK